MSKNAVVVTTIFEPTEALQKLSEAASMAGAKLFIVGDKKTPGNFNLRDAQFFDIHAQNKTDLALAKLMGENTYARKNIGYLEAIKWGAETIFESDDDNFPLPNIFEYSPANVSAKFIGARGWVNIYKYFFSEWLIWPRGFPLNQLHDSLPSINGKESIFCPIHQSLVDLEPDVDAIYRLVTGPQNVYFEKNNSIALINGAISPVNSQNTLWYREVFFLLYLPSFCSFRMTDIWRGFIATRICNNYDWGILYKAPSMFQIRNKHNLMLDFDDEVDGYQKNENIVEILYSLKLSTNPVDISSALLTCYEALVEANIFPESELTLVKAWLSDLKNILNKD